ncbi:LysE family translocator [Limnobaculum zhutongyuii]|uniref:LysE family translocator n=1 Tax=Limnobaculum zhutongyuii TaxID=2498113 RepID=A0A411WPB1_9GAMM|nr:LysE family translocator [Limnobaculum zhutongyuii]QBH98079.1 LysE family translocator [Limnobaculum zhutongyuii]TQS88063.1 LysE family translocator [Limnobaculum zhutongyuii]
MSAEFLITALVIAILPGAGVFYTLASGLSGGHRASFAASFGGTLGIVPHMLAAISGLAVILHTHSYLFEVLKYAGVVYLIVMAWNMLKSKGSFTIELNSPPSSSRKIIVSGVLLNILNPKLTLFFFALLPQFINPNDNDYLQEMMAMSAVFMLITFIVFIIYGVFASSIRGYIVTRPHLIEIMRRCFAGIFLLLAIKLAITPR